MTQVAMYLRQSKDSDGDGLAIDRQRANCTKLIEREGWLVADARVYVDNNVSASSAKPRPAYQRLIADVKAGRVDVVVAWNLDRLTRKPREIEDWLDYHESHGVNLMTSENRERIDLTTETGRMMLRITAAVARNEVERKGRRQKESNVQARSLGLPPGGRRAFGYTRLVALDAAKSATTMRLGADGVEYLAYGHEPLEPEASAVRRGFELLLAGATLGSIARAWNEAGLTTTAGAPWQPYAARNVLTNPRYAAQVAPPRSITVATAKHYLGLDDVKPGTWEPLVSVETWLASCELLRDPARRSNAGAVPRWLLSGLATCGVCGAPMKAGATRDKVKTYRCSKANHLARKADDADLYIVGQVVETLSNPDSVAKLEAAMRAKDAPDTKSLRAELLVAQQGEANVLSMVAGGLTSMAVAEATLRDVRKRIGVLEAAMAEAGKTDVLTPLMRVADTAAAWDAMQVEEQRAVVRALLSVEMLSPGKGSRPPKDDAGRMAHTRNTMVVTWH